MYSYDIFFQPTIISFRYYSNTLNSSVPPYSILISIIIRTLLFLFFRLIIPYSNWKYFRILILVFLVNL